MAPDIRTVVAGFGRRLGPELRAPFDAILTRLGDLDAYFCEPHAQPVVALPVWTAGLAERRGRPIPGVRLDEIVASAVFGYLCVRVHDDFLDEARGHPASVLMLSHALFLHHVSLLGHVARSEDLWLDYAEAMLLEHRLLREGAWDEASWERALRRSHPLVLPAAAVLEAAGLADLGPAVEDLVRHLVRAHQRFHDLLDAWKDLGNGNLTWTVRRYGGLEGRSVLNRRLLLEGGFDAEIRASNADLDVVSERGREMGLTEAVSYVDDRRGIMAQAQRMAFSRLFEAFVADPGKHR